MQIVRLQAAPADLKTNGVLKNVVFEKNSTGQGTCLKIRSSEDPYLAGTISTCDTSGFFRIENYLAEDVKYVLFSETVPSKKNSMTFWW